MKIELRLLAEIRPYENNPRLNDDAVDAVAKSIQEFGFRQPIVVDTEGVIICGHTRYKAAKKLGLEKVPVHVATDLSPEQIKAYRIADNKSAELSDWDYDLCINVGDSRGIDFRLGPCGKQALYESSYEQCRQMLREELPGRRPDAYFEFNDQDAPAEPALMLAAHA